MINRQCAEVHMNQTPAEYRQVAQQKKFMMYLLTTVTKARQSVTQRPVCHLIEAVNVWGLSQL